MLNILMCKNVTLEHPSVDISYLFLKGPHSNQSIIENQTIMSRNLIVFCLCKLLCQSSEAHEALVIV